MPIYNGPIWVDEYGNITILQPVTIQKGELERYLKWQNKKEQINKN